MNFLNASMLMYGMGTRLSNQMRYSNTTGACYSIWKSDVILYKIGLEFPREVTFKTLRYH